MVDRRPNFVTVGIQEKSAPARSLMSSVMTYVKGTNDAVDNMSRHVLPNRTAPAVLAQPSYPLDWWETRGRELSARGGKGKLLLLLGASLLSAPATPVLRLRSRSRLAGSVRRFALVRAEF